MAGREIKLQSQSPRRGLKSQKRFSTCIQITRFFHYVYVEIRLFLSGCHDTYCLNENEDKLRYPSMPTNETIPKVIDNKGGSIEGGNVLLNSKFV
jgi:hypothetical protein